ncbi:MAG: hypothetical protein KDA89_19175 [Planctomycetaceae bacterium]|nr:hypothetical protein [Planctomycetaceae bacterium]
MSKPVAYSVVIRNGRKQRFEEIWVTLYRELLWGPDAFVEWLEAGGETDYDPEELSGVAIVDMDSQTLQWGEESSEPLPCVQVALHKLMQQAWPGFEITILSRGQMYKVVRSVARLEGPAARHSDDDDDGEADDADADADDDDADADDDARVPIVITGLDDDLEDDSPANDDFDDDADEDDQEYDPFDYRPSTVREASGLYDEDEDDEDEDEFSDDDEDVDEDELDEDDESDWPSAWMTIVDQNGKVRHRRIHQIPKDLLTGVRTAVQDLAQLKAAEVPAEEFVTEGFWINVKDRQIGIWGTHATLECFDTLQKSWPKWKVVWAVNGYSDQCTVSGIPGMPMSDTDVLVKFLAQVLSTKKMDFGDVLGAVGGGLKKTAVKATGCLVAVLSLPILLGGFFFGKLKESGYAIGALVVIVAIAFKVIEFRLKAKFKKAPFNLPNAVSERRPVVAGPLDPKKREEELDRLLTACNFPAVSELRPHFPENPLEGLI